MYALEREGKFHMNQAEVQPGKPLSLAVGPASGSVVRVSD